MTLRQPIPRVRRQQEHLLTITHKKVLGHTQKCLNRTGRTRGLRDTHHATQKRYLYRIVNNFLWQQVQPQDITIITFNQDIQAEKILERLSNGKQCKCPERLFAFPSMYAIPRSDWKEITQPSSKSHDVFTVSGNPECLSVLKLHGSLNWYSTHTTSTPTRQEMLAQDRLLSVTRRRTIDPDMKLKTEKRSKYTFPVVVPPVTHKSSVLPALLGPVWDLAEHRLVEADEIIVLGYSCPTLDFESANLLRRAHEKRSSAPFWTVIDPHGEVATRYISLLGLHQLNYYCYADDYLKATAPA